MNLKFFKTKKTFKKGGIHIDPEIFWNICLLIACILIAVFSIFGFQLFQKTSKELILPAPSVLSQTKAIDRDSIQRVLDYFSERDQQSAKIINFPSSVVDPSL